MKAVKFSIFATLILSIGNLQAITPIKAYSQNPRTIENPFEYASREARQKISNKLSEYTKVSAPTEYVDSIKFKADSKTLTFDRNGNLLDPATTVAVPTKRQATPLKLNGFTPELDLHQLRMDPQGGLNNWGASVHFKQKVKNYKVIKI